MRSTPLEDLVADCLLNQRLVEAGIWETLLVEMDEREHREYKQFVEDHRWPIHLLCEASCI